MSSIQSIVGETDAPRSRGSAASLFERAYSDPAKAIVMAHVGQLVARGLAECRLLDDDGIELRLSGGATFILGKKAIIRVS